MRLSACLMIALLFHAPLVQAQVPSKPAPRSGRYRPAMARPRGARARADVVLAADGRGVSRRRVRADARQSVPAARRDDPLGAVHRRDGQQGHARRCSPGTRHPADLADADPPSVEEIVHPTGFFRQKTKSLIGMATALEERLRRRGADRARRPRDAARGRPQDRQRGPLGGVRPARACRSTRTSAGSRAGSASRPRPTPVKVEHDLNALVPPDERGRVLAAAHPARPAVSATRAAPAATCACSTTSARRRSRSDAPPGTPTTPLSGRLREVRLGPLQRATRAQESPLRREQVGCDERVGGVVVALGDLGDASCELVHLRAQGGQLARGRTRQPSVAACRRPGGPGKAKAPCPGGSESRPSEPVRWLR